MHRRHVPEAVVIQVYDDPDTYPSPESHGPDREVRWRRYDHQVVLELSALDPVRQVKLDDARIVDYAADGSVVGVEFISPSRGLNLAEVPHAAEIRREARRLGFPVRSARTVRAPR